MFRATLHVAAVPREENSELECVLDGEILVSTLPRGGESIELPGLENPLEIIGIYHECKVHDGAIVSTPKIHCEATCMSVDQYIVVVKALIALDFIPSDNSYATEWARLKDIPAPYEVLDIFK